MTKKSTPRSRILDTLRGGKTDFPTWSIYMNMLPQGERERLLRNNGLALIAKHIMAATIETPWLEVIRRERKEDGRTAAELTYHTPKGELHEKRTSETDYGTSEWRLEYLFKEPQDYPALQYMIENSTLRDNYSALANTAEQLGEDGIVYIRCLRSPFQRMNIELMGPETFCYELCTASKSFLDLYECLEEQALKMCAIACKAPGELVWLPENLTDCLISPQNFLKYYCPFYNKMAEKLHAAGKKLVVHMDGTLANLSDLIAGTAIDVIEGFTPPPMGTLPLKTALKKWPDKYIWSNLPASYFVMPAEKISQATEDMLMEASGEGRFLIGITEDLPPQSRYSGLLAMAEGMKNFAGNHFKK